MREFTVLGNGRTVYNDNVEVGFESGWNAIPIWELRVYYGQSADLHYTIEQTEEEVFKNFDKLTSAIINREQFRTFFRELTSGQ